MKTTKATLLAGFLALISLPFVGCVGHHDLHTTHEQKAVMCSKCKVEIVSNTTRSYRHGTMKIMLCPDCESAAANFFRTGELKHHCALCGGTMTCYDK